MVQQKNEEHTDVLAKAVASMDIEPEPVKAASLPQPSSTISLSDFVPSTYRPNRYSHPSLMQNNGAFIQIMSHNCNDAANVLGCLRIPYSDPNEVQYYIATHRREILVEAVAMLDQHFKDCQSAVGILEDDLTVDDYSLTFMVATINAAGMAMNQGRKEGGLWMLNYASYLEFSRASFYSEINPNLDTYQITVNAYIHLNEPHRRQRTVVKRHLEDAFTKAEKARHLQDGTGKPRKPARDPSAPRAPPMDRPDTCNPGPVVQSSPGLTQPLTQPDQQPPPSPMQAQQPALADATAQPQQQPQMQPQQAVPPGSGSPVPVVPQPTGAPQQMTPAQQPAQPAPQPIPPLMSQPNQMQQAQQPYYQQGYQPQHFGPNPQQNQPYSGPAQQRRRQQQAFQPQQFQQQFQPQFQQQPFQQQPFFQQQQYQPSRPRRNNRKGPYDGSRPNNAGNNMNMSGYPPMPQGTQPAANTWTGPIPVMQG